MLCIRQQCRGDNYLSYSHLKGVDKRTVGDRTLPCLPTHELFDLYLAHSTSSFRWQPALSAVSSRMQRNTCNARNTTHARSGQWQGWNLLSDMGRSVFWTLRCLHQHCIQHCTPMQSAREWALSRNSPRVRVRVSVSIVYRIATGGYSWIWPVNVWYGDALCRTNVPQCAVMYGAVKPIHNALHMVTH